jgi:CelD/BcsL family acetyltransferase involved in cellulose biosynthesis
MRTETGARLRGGTEAVRVQVATEVAELERLAASWDRLAVDQSRPRSAPDWVIAWCRHLLPRRAHLRVIAVWEDDALTGIAPLFVHRNPSGLCTYRLAGTGILYGVEPLVRSGDEDVVMPIIARAVSRLNPHPDVVDLDCVLGAHRWLRIASEEWGRPEPWVVSTDVRAPMIWLGDGYAEWLAARPSKFRKRLRYLERKLRAEGFEPTLHTDAASVAERLAVLAAQYESRKQARAGAGLLFDHRVRAMISDAAESLDGTGRVCLVTWERPGRVAASLLGMGAGHEVSAWVTGFDPAWSNESPGILNMATMAEQAAEAGYDVLDLGPGEEPYKGRFTDRARGLEHSVLSGRNRWPFHTPAQLLAPERREALLRRARPVWERTRRGRADRR